MQFTRLTVVALVIGNTANPKVQTLVNPVNDAQDMAVALV
jgi:uncharacterized caspase-like protein